MFIDSGITAADFFGDRHQGSAFGSKLLDEGYLLLGHRRSPVRSRAGRVLFEPAGRKSGRSTMFRHGRDGPQARHSGPEASETRPQAQGHGRGAQGGGGGVRGCSSTAPLSLPPKTPYRKKDIGGSEVPVPQWLPLTPLSSRLILRKFAPGNFPGGCSPVPSRLFRYFY
jgi:hypothetical protein